MIKAILLDLDNTMVFFDEPLFYERYFKRIIPWFAELIPPEQFRDRLLTATMALRENSGKASNRSFFIKRLCNGDAERGRKVWNRFMKFYESEYDKISVPVSVPAGLPAVMDHLVTLEIPLVLASNPIFPQIAQKKRLQWGGIDSGIFDLMTHIENMSFVKPRKDYYRQICEMIAVSAEACLMVGNDPINDMVAANIGMKTYLTNEVADIDYASLSLTNDQRKGAVAVPEPDFTGPFARVPDALQKLSG